MKFLEKAKKNLQHDITEKQVIIKSNQLLVFEGRALELALLYQNLIQNGIKYKRSEPPVINIKHLPSEEALIISF